MLCADKLKTLSPGTATRGTVLSGLRGRERESSCLWKERLKAERETGVPLCLELRDGFETGKCRTLKHRYLFLYYTPTHAAMCIPNTIIWACTQIHTQTHMLGVFYTSDAPGSLLCVPKDGTMWAQPWCELGCSCSFKFGGSRKSQGGVGGQGKLGVNEMMGGAHSRTPSCLQQGHPDPPLGPISLIILPN